jgi:hypothetical protein
MATKRKAPAARTAAERDEAARRLADRLTEKTGEGLIIKNPGEPAMRVGKGGKLEPVD